MVLLILSVKGYMKGFIHELFSFLIIVVGLTASFIFYRPLNSIINIFIENNDLSLIISFLSIFIFAMIMFVIIRNTFSNLVNNLNFTDIDSFLGLIIGLIKGIIICSACLIFLNNHPVLNVERAIKNSFIYPFIENFFIALLSLFPHDIHIIIIRFFGIE